MTGCEVRYCPFCRMGTVVRLWAGRAGFGECTRCGCCVWPLEADEGVDWLATDVGLASLGLHDDAIGGET